MTDASAVRTSPIVPDEQLRNALRRQVDRAINITREFTRSQLAAESGVNIYQIDAILSRDPAKQRRVALEDAFSIASVLGETAINAILAPLGFAAKPLDEADAICLHAITAGITTHLATIAVAAADGRIDHIERPGVERAAEGLIATVLPLAGVGRAA